jgi:two-component system phosphate regulon sensor histidine kinase PhoR
MKSINPKQIYYIAAICLLLILGAQAYLIYDYFQTTRDGLIRESDTILDEVFKKDLNARNKKFNHLIGGDTITIIPPPRKENTFKADISKVKELKGNAIGEFQLVINQIISKMVPMQLACIDSITGLVLTSRDINTSYIIKIVDPRTDTLLAQSRKDIKSSVFQIQSKSLIYDYENSKALQLVLVNPFGVIIKRMGLMLIATLALSIICLLAFQQLRRILAKQKQLVAFKNDFLSTIAHEMKRPLASLSLQLDCMALPAYSDNRQQQELLLNRSMNATAELNATINMIVALAKLEEGLLTLNKAPVNLKQLFEEMKSRFVNYQDKKIEIKTVYAPDEIYVSGDEQLLNQCFANLIDNAIKYSNQEVLIEITIHKSGHWVIVSVNDNGYGIPEDKLPSIFEKYNRAHTENTKINGFGIGLNYVKTIVEEHKGKVEVKSQPKLGSEFKIMLPG